MTRKAKSDPAQGTYALCISTGFILGVGLGPMLGSVLVSIVVGIVLGGAAGYFFTHLKERKNKH
jgi:hypothetical protein